MVRPRGVTSRAFRATALLAAVHWAGLRAAVAQSFEVPPIPTVTVVVPSPACFNDVVPFTGFTVAQEEVLVIPETEGARISEVLIEEGARVAAGQALARLTSLAPAQPGTTASTTFDVVAPVSGVVIAREARIGALASPQSPAPLFRLARDGAMEVVAGLPAARLTNLRPGQAARVQIPGSGETVGRVRLVAPKIDRQTRLGQVRISIQSSPRLRFGATVAGVIDAGRSCGPSIPVSALQIEGERTLVQRVRDGRVESTPVQLGIVQGALAEIREGLNAGDLVVARAAVFLSAGDVVRTLPEQTRP
ncbi:efflux RND transporter periplasmic adaptor subunit [Microvirga massiliensis]|uniref:efflux RND transporter periplasmic adaptor subunit n=1 Tax=Microvirga massiliensis TaxID=1033741 RepID=UPI00062BCEA3|nr:efflux RND transporter periplasmic adaptor subunit [Microvirga massiliensis]